MTSKEIVDIISKYEQVEEYIKNICKNAYLLPDDAYVECFYIEKDKLEVTCDFYSCYRGSEQFTITLELLDLPFDEAVAILKTQREREIEEEAERTRLQKEQKDRELYEKLKAKFES